MICIQSSTKRNVGDVVTDAWITDAEGEFHELPFKVIRELTKDEFIEYWKNYPEPKAPIMNNPKFVWFYEVLMD